KTFFLFKHFELFKRFVFYLEIEVSQGSYITIRRNVEEASKIALKTHRERRSDFSQLVRSEWDHFDVPLKRARELLDSHLDLSAVRPWDYRKGLGYLLRSQEDYLDVFQLRKFTGPHKYWKPYLAQLLGFDAEIVSRQYENEEQLAATERTIETLRQELGEASVDAGKVSGMLLLKQRELDDKQRLLDAFDFERQDTLYTKDVVDNIDEEIALLNARRYSLNVNRKKVIGSLDAGEIRFDTDEAAKLFREANVFFEGQIRRDFDQLIAFNKAITEERRQYLQAELEEIDAELTTIEKGLGSLGGRRSEMLSFLSETDSFAKYKQFSRDVISLRVEVESLERQREFLHRQQELRSKMRALNEEKNVIQDSLERSLQDQESDARSLFSKTRLNFSEIVESVIDRKAVLYVEINSAGHLDFKADILGEGGGATSADKGHSYRKLLCIAFDLAILRAHLDQKFPRFVFHDGVFESLDDRKKAKLMDVMRQYSAMGIQQVITSIDSDVPDALGSPHPFFSDLELVVRLHDEGDDGRLFRMPSW
ncbi:MAG: DUF2326 domain-containing protein, partial [Candidatus Lustribacter sp.]